MVVFSLLFVRPKIPHKPDRVALDYSKRFGKIHRVAVFEIGVAGGGTSQTEHIRMPQGYDKGAVSARRFAHHCPRVSIADSAEIRVDHRDDLLGKIILVPSSCCR